MKCKDCKNAELESDLEPCKSCIDATGKTKNNFQSKGKYKITGLQIRDKKNSIGTRLVGFFYSVGKNCEAITEHEPRGDGDLFYYDIFQIFKNAVTGEKANAKKRVFGADVEAVYFEEVK